MKTRTANLLLVAGDHERVLKIVRILTEKMFFRLDLDTIRILHRIPNTSEFIRKAVLAYLGDICPLCKGRKRMQPGLQEHFAPIFPEIKKYKKEHGKDRALQFYMNDESVAEHMILKTSVPRKKRPMPKKQRVRQVNFRVPVDLAEELKKVPCQAAFVRRAIEMLLERFCPLCHGKGVVSRGMHDHFAPMLASYAQRKCESCGTMCDLRLGDEDDCQRLEQFFEGGPLYCEYCYPRAPSCSVAKCNWHLMPDRIIDHMKQRHEEKKCTTP